ncbi:EDR1-related protein [Gimesia panareensis]|uniref:EDR1-related protein n=1 Tax=Gimesia panareensis TaxID=2527978 RepID=UPI00118D1665|nr:EDR1-related protein [Gimesia panareensis]QDU53698.1 hypothetical protein Pan110_60920 [Gimesia panareensis]
MTSLRMIITGLLFLFSLCLQAQPVTAEVTLIPSGKASVWKYDDNATPPRADWMLSTFDDQAWSSGPAPLGFGDAGLNTTVRFGADPQQKQITTYFRHTFQVPADSKLQQLVLLIRSDDGVIVYLNGTEIARNNLPGGQVTPETTAINALGGVLERLYQRFTLPADRLQPGTNLLAVEVHQANSRSTDLFLDLILRGYQNADELRPTLKTQSQQAASDYHTKHFIAPQLKILDGYVDGGRGMQLDPQGHARSRRELIVVDRQRDAALKKHLEFARSKEVMSLAPDQRAMKLAQYVDQNMSLDKNNRATMAAVSLLTDEYANQGVLLGDVTQLCGAGVCRHRALLFKILADEADLDVALVRGNYGDATRHGGHAWNELHLKDGRRILIDTMQRRIELLTPEGSKVSDRYLTIDNKPWYGKSKAAKENSDTDSD